MAESSTVDALRHQLADAENRAAAAEAALREASARNRALTERGAQAIWETDPAGVVVKDSPSWRAYTGQTRDEWLRYGWLDAIHPEDRDYAERQWREAMAAHSVVDAEFRLRAPDAGWRWTNVLAAPMRDASGSIEKWLGLNIDINDRKRAEADLKASEARLQLALDATGLAWYEWDLVTDQLTANDSFRNMVGVNPGGSVLGSDLMEKVVHAQDRHRVEADLAGAMESGSTGRFVFEHRLNLANPLDERWMLSHGQVFFEGPDHAGRPIRIFGTLLDITERKLMEGKLRDGEQRQAFLVKLGDALRGHSSPQALISAAARLLGEHLATSRIMFAEFDEARGVADIFFGWFADGAQPFPIVMKLDEFEGAVLADLRAGRVVRLDDALDPSVDRQDLKAVAELGVIAMISVPLIIDGRLRVNLSVHDHFARHWTDQEVSIVQEVAERVWADLVRLRAEAALRDSEERLRQFGRASSDGLWIRDAETLKLQYASDAMEVIYGISIDAMTADPLAWPALIVPEDREETFGYIERVKAGESVVHEFRIQRPSDLQFRWIRSVGFPLLDEMGIATRIAGISSDITVERQLAEHQSVLLHELQHRVRNLMGVVRSIGNRSADSAASVEGYRQTLEGRMLALARVQALLTREANAGGSVRDIIESEVKVQAHHPHQYELVGPDIMLSPKAVEVLTLAFHELSTNALKYGAFSVAEGKLTVSWSSFDRAGTPWLGIDWREQGAPPRQPSARRGFGSELIEARIPYELGGTGKVSIEPDGAHCHMEFPLREAESILETDAPTPTTTFGGTTDMTGAPDLGGRTVLVVEDDYYMAADTVAALRGAGAQVLGPCPSEEATLGLLGTQMPTHAVLDLNLGGGGPRFEIAHMLRSNGVPFIFITGYDPDIIPVDLADVPRLQKPVPFRTIVEAVSRL